ncbi:putative ADP-ribosylation factor GTPase-activating protein AGD6 [Hibiscus syriacus]|uniref:ADP-ribosylation factor GTPase-activating protein AGD6 n=1 Tax=Hibiscus syriacus TaxID=106335 RepID=A0A6A3B5A9_HIBSY|nr:putative ADP-ribosylation factor GTPase-activating protein AGD6 [Hibiscus syriacus]
MESGGNGKLNVFLAQYGVPKETDIVTKYNTDAASVYRDRIQALAEGRAWRDPPVVKESVNGGAGGNRKPPLSGGGSWGGNDAGWDSWDNEDSFRSSSDMRRNQSASDFRSGNYHGGRMGGAPVKSRSIEDMYTRSQLEASTANKDSFFARKMAENDSRPDGLPHSQGGKYVVFGSSPMPTQRRIWLDTDGNPIQAHGGGMLYDERSSTYNWYREYKDGPTYHDHKNGAARGIGKLSLVAASAAQSAANVVQAGTKEFTTKVSVVGRSKGREPSLGLGYSPWPPFYGGRGDKASVWAS